MNAEAGRFVVGLTGGIGAGKSAAAEALAALGAVVVDTDAISRALTSAGGAAMPAIAREFGPQFVSAEGALDRAAMRVLAFADESRRARLEAILHPAIRAVADQALAEQDGPYAVLVVPLLFETGGYRTRVASTVVVDCHEEIQVRRVMARSSLSEAQVRAIMAAQWPRWRRLQLADDLLWNGGDRASLERQCARLHENYCGRAHASPTIAASPGPCR
jgi:dephospho-CoA kinase